MSTHHLDLIFKPQRVAVIGASEEPGSVGATLFRNLISAGFPGVVYPVNPKRESVQGVQAYPDVASLPRKPDLAVMATPAYTVPDIVRQCGEAGILGIVIISAGFREIGERGREREAEVEKAGGSFPACASSAPTAWASSCPART